MDTLRIKITFTDNSPSDEDTEAQSSLDAYIKAENNTNPEISEYITEAQFTSGDRCELIYKENEQLGMGNSSIKISWLYDEPQILSIMRSGDVETALTFETGKRHISAYNLMGLSFEMCTRTLKAINTFDGTKKGTIYVDYIIEVKGSFAGRRKMKIDVL